MIDKREDNDLSKEVIADQGGHSCCSSQGKEKNMKKHILHMVLCCGLPIILLLLVPFIAKVNPWAAGALGMIAPFICPLMMGSMVFMAFKNIK